MIKVIFTTLLNVLFFLTLQAQNEIVVDLISLDVCQCIREDSTSQTTDDLIANIETCIEESVIENQSVIEQVWQDSTREFSLEVIDADFGRLLGENLATSCPAFVEKIQQFQNNSSSASGDSEGGLMDRLLYGNKLMSESNCAEAIKVYSEVIYQSSSDSNTRATAYNNRAVCRNEIGDYYRAISDLYVALELVPNFQLPYVNLAESKTFIGDYESAKSDANYAIELDSTRNEAYSVRGYTNFYLGLYEEAISDFNTALKLDSLNVDAIYGKGLVYINTEDYESAIENFLISQRMSDDYPDLVFYLSSAYENLGDIDKAIDIIKNDPLLNSNYIKLNQIGLLYYGINDYDSSITYYSRSISVDSTSSQVLLNRAYAYQDSDDHLSAIADLNKVLEMGDNAEQAYLYRGISKIELEQYENAIADFESTLSLNEFRAEAYDYRARAKFELNDFDGAIGDYSKSIEIYDTDAVVFKERGEVYLKLNDLQSACSDFINAKDLGSENVDELISQNCTEE